MGEGGMGSVTVNLIVNLTQSRITQETDHKHVCCNLLPFRIDLMGGGGGVCM